MACSFVNARQLFIHCAPRRAFLFLCLILVASACPTEIQHNKVSVKPVIEHQPNAKKEFHFVLPKEIKKLHINIGPNVSPILPPDNDKSVGVIVVEPNIGVAHYLREEFQKKRYVSRFFVINAAIAGPPRAGRFLTFNHYNIDGASSSLSPARKGPNGRPQWFANRKTFDPSRHYGPGPAGVDFVPVLSLEALLQAVPDNVEITFLKTDTQGFDLSVVKSAPKKSLRRIGKIMTETYLPGIEKVRYQNVKNDLQRDWMPFMKKNGFRLRNPTSKLNEEYDAIWIRSK